MILTVASIMTRQVICVSPNATIAEIAEVLASHDLSAAPVCEDSRLLGIVSQGDLMRQFAEAEDLRPAWWLGIIRHRDTLVMAAADYILHDHRCARDLMTPDPVTVTESMPLPDLACCLLRYNIKRAPVLSDLRMTGIVSRADLIRAMAVWPDAPVATAWKPSTIGRDRPGIPLPDRPDTTADA